MFTSIIIFLVLCSKISTDCSTDGIRTHIKESDGQKRISTTIEGNYTVQLLLSLTEKESNCTKVTKDGMKSYFSFKHATDQVNKNRNFNKWVKLGIQIDDICLNIPSTMARGIELVSPYQKQPICRADFLACPKANETGTSQFKRPSAVIGAQFSFLTIPLASLLSVYNTPLISPGASSRLLSQKNLYKSFFRTIPSDTYQVKVMVDILERFQWNYIFAIGSDDDYGKFGVIDLQKEALARNICISYVEYLPFHSNRLEARITEVVAKIKDTPRAKAIVLFCFPNSQGRYILEEAERQDLHRVWISSETWNPSALTIPISLQSQMEGLLTVSLKLYPNDMPSYVKEEIKTGWKCNIWLQTYVKHEFNCKPVTLREEKLFGTNCSVPIQDIVDSLNLLPQGTTDNDAIFAIAHAIKNILNTTCAEKADCVVEHFEPKWITEELFNVSFVNFKNQKISFDEVGDLQFPHYTIENMRVINVRYEYVTVGTWNEDQGRKTALELDETKIAWPRWFNATENQTIPNSRCSDECQPGKFIETRIGCCWKCSSCAGNNYTAYPMSERCEPCGSYYHANKENTGCIKTPVLWLSLTDPAGMSITVTSGVGLIVTIIKCILLFKYRHLINPSEPTSHLTLFSCLLLLLTFVFGLLHFLEPTVSLCTVRNSFFFVLLMMYPALLLTKSKTMTEYLREHANKTFKGNLAVAQLMFILMVMLLETASIIAWVYIDESYVAEFRQEDIHQIWTQCDVTFTAAKLISSFIPCIVLIVAVFYAFRERRLEHSFYEPKFLNFSCVAFCIIIVAFLPTFKFVVGVYKALVMAFTMNIFGFTFMACLVFPNVYVAVMRSRHGINTYPVKPVTGKRGKKEENNKRKITPAVTQVTKSTTAESSKSKIVHSNSIVTIPSDSRPSTIDTSEDLKIPTKCYVEVQQHRIKEEDKDNLPCPEDNTASAETLDQDIIENGHNKQSPPNKSTLKDIHNPKYTATITAIRSEEITI
ncbi:metabotropic glutamate receptor 3-like [Hydractinia symbiolongicarpus]|uniref:metabotropic glutamate receptor 3-like n=1 Tax=Hydractinia symbiolongicarpus TaxID=13093 RepID=UPI002550AE3C|nr:metabotropic glutamate receptor 3-like [Hydractinia symbiolongicarpus]